MATFSKTQLWTVIGCTFIYVPIANASGYHFGTQSVSTQSTANASTAEAADASTIFYNPAGISKLDGTQFSLNANLVMPSVKYSNASANYPDGTAISGETSGKISNSLIAVPHLYATHQLSDNWTAGLGVYVPFASGTEYSRDSVLRYNVNKMELTAIDINPTLAYNVNDKHSFAIGLVGQYATAELRQYANLGRLAGLGNGIDSYATVKGNDWGFGYTLGYLWDINDDVRIGASYRSKIEHTLKGTATWTPDNAAYASEALLSTIRATGYVASEDASVKIVTPESLSVHGKVDINEQWSAYGDVTWTRHSRFNRLDINYGNAKVVANASGDTSACANASCTATTAQSTTLKPNWRDTFKFGIGATYQYSDDLQLRFGVAYDQSPVKSADYRLTTLPDNDRIWFSLGAKYNFSDNSDITLGYSYIHIKDTSANPNGWCGSLTASGSGAINCVSSRTDGTADYKSHANILGIQYNYRF